MELGSTSFVPPYYHGMLMLQGGLVTGGARQEAIKSFERAPTQINSAIRAGIRGPGRTHTRNLQRRPNRLWQRGIQGRETRAERCMAYAINLVYLLVETRIGMQKRGRWARRIVGEGRLAGGSANGTRVAGADLTNNAQWAAQKGGPSKDAKRGHGQPARQTGS